MVRCPARPANATLFCDGFESGLAAWPSTQGDLVLVPDPVRSGTTAVRASIHEPGGTARLILGGNIAGTTPRFWARVGLYVPASAPIVGSNIFGLNRAATGEQISIGGVDGDFTIYVRTETTAGKNGGPAPRDRWLCLEVLATIDNVAGSVELRVDGNTVASLTGIDTRASGPYNSMLFGWVYSHPMDQPATTMFIDDVEVASSPGTCL
jgi:hypothetical protein